MSHLKKILSPLLFAAIMFEPFTLQDFLHHAHGAETVTQAEQGIADQYFTAIAQSDYLKLEQLIYHHPGYLNKHYKNGVTPLVAATVAKDKKAVDLLLTGGAEINFSSKNGAPALVHATIANDSPLFKHLVNQGANWKPPVPGAPGIMELAVNKGYISIVKWLIEEQNALLPKSGAYTYRLLGLASKQGHLELLKYLVSQGADPKQKAAYQNGNLLMLAARGGQTEVFNYLRTQGLEINTRNEQGQNAVQLAALAGRLEMVKAIYGAGSVLDNIDNNGTTLAHIAVLHPTTELLEWLKLKNQNLNIPDKRGFTPLFFAVAMNKPERVQWLIKQGHIDPNMPVNGVLLLDLAKKFKRTEIINNLPSH